MLSFEEFKEKEKDTKYVDGTHKCIVCGKTPAYWEIGDSRYWCPACDEHARLKEGYAFYLKSKGR